MQTALDLFKLINSITRTFLANFAISFTILFLLFYAHPPFNNFIQTINDLKSLHVISFIFCILFLSYPFGLVVNASSHFLLEWFIHKVTCFSFVKWIIKHSNEADSSLLESFFPEIAQPDKLNQLFTIFSLIKNDNIVNETNYLKGLNIFLRNLSIVSLVFMFFFAFKQEFIKSGICILLLLYFILLSALVDHYHKRKTIKINLIEFYVHYNNETESNLNRLNTDQKAVYIVNKLYPPKERLTPQDRVPCNDSGSRTQSSNN